MRSLDRDPKSIVAHTTTRGENLYRKEQAPLPKGAKIRALGVRRRVSR